MVSSPSKCLRLTIPGLDDYPTEHTWILFTDSEEEIPSPICKSLEDLGPALSALPINEMLQHLVARLHAAGNDTLDNMPSEESDEDFEIEYNDNDYSDDEQFFSNDAEKKRTNGLIFLHGAPTDVDEQKRLRFDLRATRQAGFKVGVRGDLNHGGYLCISCRISKLGISEEAMRAWGVEPQQYFMLIIHYRHRYVRFEDIKYVQEPRLDFRVVLCYNYKPTLSQIIAKFHEGPRKNGEHSSVQQSESVEYYPIDDVFISKPLNDLLNQRSLSILRERQTSGVSWTKAELKIDESQGKARENHTNDEDSHVNDPAHHEHHHPPLVTADHVAECAVNPSLPLSMMQFTLRHFVRCTEFCLNCHCKIKASFEALKPYVCSKPLCLYQFMHLGFGPSIEWEILSQPYVVDLLISFCYVAATENRLKEFPVGLGIDTPDPTELVDCVGSDWRSSTYSSNLPAVTSDHGSRLPSTEQSTDFKSLKIINKARLDYDRMQLTFSNDAANVACPLRRRQWLMIKSPREVLHTWVEDVGSWPTVQLGKTSIVTDSASSGLKSDTSLRGSMDVTYYPYEKAFDDLSHDQKTNAILMFLNTLPKVMSMKNYLENNAHAKDATLAKWPERLSPYAVDILRWIIASNRSCIIQVDQPEDTNLASKKSVTLLKDQGKTWHPIEDRVPGMNDWMQFRFAQGAPDKEQRFVDAVKAEKHGQNMDYPTIFAWHGSYLKNWHGIIREGLHYKEVLHGRAFGDGVYLSLYYETSANYTGAFSFSGSNSHDSSVTWPQSLLKVREAISLNEVVNAPQKFLSRDPHLVVKQLDWIQTRYLFVRGDPRLLTNAMNASPESIYNQDPERTCLGYRRHALRIPITAISKSRRPSVTTGFEKKGKKKLKTWRTNRQETVGDQQEDDASVITTASDRNLLLDKDNVENEDNVVEIEDLFSNTNFNGNHASQHPPSGLTRFFPGKLKADRLPLLKAPAITSSMATKSLQKELNKMVREQATKPQHEIGWYIDADLIKNMYQWIVEMHSFDLDLPLAKEMAAAKVQSVVLELRFTDNYPYSPPFIRVIQPRFLDFAQGGGGHVTAGGAICMELLTNSGWNPASTIASVLLQVRMELTSTDPPAHLANAKSRGFYGTNNTYEWGEAMDAYKRACRTHGWTYPKEFDEFDAVAK